MMAENMAFLLFEDQSPDTYECLTGLFRHIRLDILSRCFLDQTSTALQNEIDRLSSVDRE